MMMLITPVGKKSSKRSSKKRTQIKRKIMRKSAWVKLPLAGPAGKKAKGARRGRKK
jgi:hypothetical protein